MTEYSNLPNNTQAERAVLGACLLSSDCLGKVMEILKPEDFYRNEHIEIYAAILDLYAQSLGLGTVWCDFALTITRQIPEVYAMLEIPENYTLDYILMLGIPNIRYKRTTQPDRFSIKLLK